MKRIIINENDAYQTILKFIRKTFKTMPLTLIYKLFRLKKVMVNDQIIIDKKYMLNVNDVVVINDNSVNIKVNHSSLFLSKIKLNIIYEDDYILIVDKPHNIVVHHPSGDCLDKAIRKYLGRQKGYSFTISHVHRLDKLTRGLIIYAKKKIALNVLHKLWNSESIIKKYYALLETKAKLPELVSGYLWYDELKMKMVFNFQDLSINNNSKPTITKFNFLKYYEDYSWYEIQLLTGRKHQIRASCEFLKASIVGDRKYHSNLLLENKIMLFAYKIKFDNLIYPLDYLNGSEFIINDFLENLLLR